MKGIILAGTRLYPLTMCFLQAPFSQKCRLNSSKLHGVYSCAGVPLFRRNGNRQSGGRKPLNRNRDTALKCLLPASLLA